MPRVGIHVGEDFPAEDVTSPEHDEGTCSSSEERRRRHEEWHRRARGFRDDVRHAARRHFGDHAFLAHNVIVLRVLLAIAVAALLIALLPHMLVLGAALMAIAFVAFRRHSLHHHIDMPNGEF